MSELDNYGKKRGLGIVSMRDKRLVRINPTSKDFFDTIIEFDTKNAKLTTGFDNARLEGFIRGVEEVKKTGVAPFLKPIYDPSLDGEEVVFEVNRFPAVGYPFNFWEQKVEEMPDVQGKKWNFGTTDQYYAFLVWLINSLKKKNWSDEKAIKAVVIDSRELGHFYNSKDALYDFEMTGCRKVCGVYDLGNTFKMLSGGFWRAGGAYFSGSYFNPLADIGNRHSLDGDDYGSVPWFVLS